MRPYITWLRRGTGRFLAPVLLGFLLMALFSQPDWMIELDWATRLTAASVLVVSPAVAAVAAFDTSRRLRPTLTLLGRGSVRKPWHIAFPSLAVVTWAVVAYLLTWLVAAAVVSINDGIGIHDWWVFPEVVAPLVGAGSIGLFAGMVAGPRLAPPAAVMTLLAALVCAAPWGRGPFEAVTTYGTLTGLQRPPVRAVAVVVGVLVLALAVATAAVESNRPAGARSAVLGLCAGVAAVATVLPSAWPWKVEIYDVTDEAYGCVGSAPAVCGPRSRLPLLPPVQASLAEAYTQLAGTEFIRPTAFRVTRLDHYAHLDGAAPLDFDPADVHNDRYDNDAVARALVRPHQCSELFVASSAEPLLQAQDVVIPWLLQVLAGETAATPVPDDVSLAFARIQNCRPMTGDLR